MHSRAKVLKLSEFGESVPAAEGTRGDYTKSPSLVQQAAGDCPFLGHHLQAWALPLGFTKNVLGESWEVGEEEVL